jgi:ubiquinone biosynthesis monooxygenase Coq7
MFRSYHFWDKCCIGFDQALRALTGSLPTTEKKYPAEEIAEADLSEKERQHAAALMRVNHAGEICAQGLYHGQAIVSRSPSIQQKMQQAAQEEGDHLTWCQQRLTELSSHPSYLNPLWYSGSFCIGMAAGMIGDSWSLGFVAETERQVIRHLQHHLDALPPSDQRSYHILQQMEQDEAKHRDEAVECGARELPSFIKQVMSWTAKVMVKTSYWI